ncbi:membrane protein [Streptomyces sp. NRRL B-1568]|nr:membrane protein [Streptomyces sp. NRRL B-1568]
MAHALTPVLCNETALVNAITAANATGGDTLALIPGCTYTLTSAHGSGPTGPVGLPPLTAPITLLGLGATIARDPSAPPFRILQVEGAANVPGTKGQLSMVGVTIRGGSAVAPFPGGGITNLGGTVFLVSSSVTGNTAVAGGGIYTDQGAVSLTASSVTSNTATTRGGGIYVNSGGVTMLASTVSGNTPDNCAPSGSVVGCT